MVFNAESSGAPIKMMGRGDSSYLDNKECVNAVSHYYL